MRQIPTKKPRPAGLSRRLREHLEDAESVFLAEQAGFEPAEGY
jgi:hypothetical protein